VLMFHVYYLISHLSTGLNDDDCLSDDIDTTMDYNVGSVSQDDAALVQSMDHG